MRTLKWGMSGDDVAALQQALADCGYFGSAVDGRFGPLTRSAVRNFQADNDLDVDGVAGPATQAALGLGATTGGPGVPAGPATGGPLAVSLHIGVNRVDPARYGGWDGALHGCENDARTMTAIATAEGFTTSQLLTAQATTANVLAGISAAALQLTSGGTFLLTYAGHGGQVPNVGADVEEDQQDETWVLFDRQLLDDELEQAFAAFTAGVDIVLLSDSCHSGTVHRAMDATQMQFAELKRSFYVDLAVPRPGPGDAGTLAAFPRPVAASRTVDAEADEQRQLYARAAGPDVGAMARSRSAPAAVSRFPGQSGRGGVALLTRPGVSRGAEADAAPAAVATRAMPLGTNTQVNALQAEVLDAVRAAARSRGAIRANGLLISGCLDSQLSQEVGGAGVFTTTLRSTWADNGFTGSYTEFHRAILSRMGPTQTPALSLFGGQPGTLVTRTPFDP